jgi:multisubunit Na+/H+ antiporter MnhG subunit
MLEFLYQLSAVLGSVLMLVAIGLLMIDDNSEDRGTAVLCATVGVVMIVIASQGL